MAAGAYVPMGRITRLHGLKGEVVVREIGDHPFFLSEGMKAWFVPPPPAVREATVTAVRETRKGWVVRFAEVTDPSTAESLVGATLSVDEGALPEGWDAVEFDETGLTVVDEQRGELGTIEEIIVTGANDVWVVRGDRYGEVLVPVIDDVVIEIDEEARTATVRLLPGLIEED